MSKYTIKLNEICDWLVDDEENTIELLDTKMQNEWGGGFLVGIEHPFQNLKNLKIDERIEKARPLLFDFDYPVYNEDGKGEERKKSIETKIIKHYYLHEIGFETVGRFLLALNERLNLIMPYYNEMYKSIDLQGDNPLTNTDLYETKDTQNKNKTTNEQTDKSTTNATGNTTNQNTDVTTGNNKQVFKDTPLNELDNTDYATNITTNEGKNTTDSNGTTTMKNDTTVNATSNGNINADLDEKMQRHVVGLNQYSKQDMITRYRDNIINIDEAIVNELYDLFMLIY